MIYTLPLKTIGIATGIFLLLTHTFALLQKDSTRAWLQKLPRSRTWGSLLLSLAAFWTFLLISKMDLGEFSHLRTPMLGFVALAAFLSWKFLDEFLSARCLGILALLAAHPILDACFLQSPSWRLILVVIAYIWIILGLLWVGMPYLLRDQIAWISASHRRWNIAAGMGILLGLVILACACKN